MAILKKPNIFFFLLWNRTKEANVCGGTLNSVQVWFFIILSILINSVFKDSA